MAITPHKLKDINANNGVIVDKGHTKTNNGTATNANPKPNADCTAHATINT